FAALRDFAIRKSSRLAPALIAAVIHRGCAPRPDQVLPDLSRYFGASLRPASLLRRAAAGGRPRRGAPPVRAASWARRGAACLEIAWATSSRSFKSASSDIEARPGRRAMRVLLKYRFSSSWVPGGRRQARLLKTWARSAFGLYVGVARMRPCAISTV